MSFRKRIRAAQRALSDLKYAGGTDGLWPAVVYRAWQLGHWVHVRPHGGVSQHDYQRCSCGWEGRTTRDGGGTLPMMRHLSDVVFERDGVAVPRIESWPLGITAKSSVADLYQALRESGREPGESL